MRKRPNFKKIAVETRLEKQVEQVLKEEMKVMKRGYLVPALVKKDGVIIGLYKTPWGRKKILNLSETSKKLRETLSKEIDEFESLAWKKAYNAPKIEERISNVKASGRNAAESMLEAERNLEKALRELTEDEKQLEKFDRASHEFAERVGVMMNALDAVSRMKEKLEKTRFRAGP